MVVSCVLWLTRLPTYLRTYSGTEEEEEQEEDESLLSSLSLFSSCLERAHLLATTGHGLDDIRDAEEQAEEGIAALEPLVAAGKAPANLLSWAYTTHAELAMQCEEMEVAEEALTKALEVNPSTHPPT